MKIKSLYIKDYYILQDFNINFSSNLSVLIGENGSGKSSVLECLAYIFGHLHKYFVLGDKTADFIEGYKINYEINDFDVFIESKYVASNTNTFQPIIKINDEDISVAQIKKKYGGFKQFLPSKVILFYSGITERLKSLSNHFEKKFIDEIIRSNNPYSLIPLNLPESNPFIYVKKEYISFILLALFVLKPDDENFILNRIGIDFNGCITTIKLHKPHWAKSDKKNNNSKNLWGITGKIATDFLKGLDEIGLPVKIDEKSKSITYKFYGSIGVQDLFHDYFKLQPNQVVSFLDTLLCDDLLESVNITWDNGFSIDKLSEGEKQLILSIGLSLVLNDKNLLFLLDEPDVSLHPKWQQEFISNINKGLNDESMAIVTTHSPSLVSDLNNKNLSLIRNGKLVTKSFNYYGKTVNEILIDYFGLESIRNKNISKKIDDLWSLIRSDNYKSDDFEKLKKELTTIIGNDDPEIMAMNSDILRKEYEENK